jgi:hypothetical protein
VSRPPCACDPARCTDAGCYRVTGGPYTPDQCRVCWLYHTSEAARAGWGGPPAPPEPGLLRKAAAFAGAVVRHAAAGLPQAPPAEAARRLALCLECPEFVAGKQSCRRCGCDMPRKVRWAEQACPLGKWGPVPPA